MPTPEQQAPWQRALPSELAVLFDKQDERSLAREISELRREIAALRAELAPVPSLILTGRKVIDEFKRMKEPT